MKGITNVLTWLNENWTAIIVIVGLLTSLGMKIKDYLKLSKEERVKIAMKAVSETILEKITTAEIKWNDFVKSGEIKRSEVLNAIYTEYPILKEYIDQDELIKQLDDMINEGLKKMQEVIDKTIDENDADETKDTDNAIYVEHQNSNVVKGE